MGAVEGDGVSDGFKDREVIEFSPEGLDLGCEIFDVVSVFGESLNSERLPENRESSIFGYRGVLHRESSFRRMGISSRREVKVNTR